MQTSLFPCQAAKLNELHCLSLCAIRSMLYFLLQLFEAENLFQGWNALLKRDKILFTQLEPINHA